MKQKKFGSRRDEIKIDWGKEMIDAGKVVLSVDEIALHDMVTRLYDDPANTFIEWDEIIYLARDKIMGINISKRLIQKRKNADIVWTVDKVYRELEKD